MASAIYSNMVSERLVPGVSSGGSSGSGFDIILALVLINQADQRSVDTLQVILIFLFQVLTGLILPTLARMRTMYVPNEFCAGMISLSLAPTIDVVLCGLIQGAYYRNLNNSTIACLAAMGLLLAAGCMYLLKNFTFSGCC